MKILGKDLKKGDISIEITDEEDLWSLSHVLSKGDLVKGKTERKIKIGSDENAKVVRKTIFLKIQTEKVEYEPQNNSLRILGTIKEGPDDVSIGSHHSFNLEIRDKINIQKNWANFELKKLEEATKPKSNILLVVFDRQNSMFGLTKRNGYEILSEFEGDVQKKDTPEEKKGNFYKEIGKQIEEYNTRFNPDKIIIASPAFWKEYLEKELSSELNKKIIKANISEVNKTSFNELLKRTELKKALEDERTSRELQAVEEIMTAISHDKACYGVKETKQKITEGAVKKIMVSENLLKKMKEKENYKEIDFMLRNAEQIQSEIIFITQKETMQKLDSLGGIAGTLRW
ncbi:mRNA surveillance protein pelota [Candidatus Woesearchaeota archaeon]|nr:mRNA surveillance protein pelota [Candidatus Woesearchaeota archaeon]MCF7900789.1 mRNA surveillance protein pelota [Candidatus Woesearchaeota archaeon]MCF8013091.1 mRNA surveillance protein pelota [Candidatus Woesearchaeota archaeon]